MLGEAFGGIGGGGRFGGFIRIRVLSTCIHWLINGMIDDDDEILFGFERCADDVREEISFADLERLKGNPWVLFEEVSGGEVDLVRSAFFSALLALEWRKEEWNDDERINSVCDALRRSI